MNNLTNIIAFNASFLAYELIYFPISFTSSFSLENDLIILILLNNSFILFRNLFKLVSIWPTFFESKKLKLNLLDIIPTTNKIEKTIVKYNDELIK